MYKQKWRQAKRLCYWHSCAAVMVAGMSVLAGCSNTPPAHLAQQNSYFRTLITPQQIKRFELTSLPKRVDPLNTLHRRSAQYDDESSDAWVLRKTEAYLQYQVKSMVESTGYCKQGYILLGRFAGESQYRLRGECKDLATSEDYTDFPNTIAQW